MDTIMAMEDFLRAMQSASQAEEDEPQFPVMEAQAMELKARWESVQTIDQTLKPGDLVMEKPGLGSRRQPFRSKELMILWRMLNPDDWIDARHIKAYLEGVTADRPDCMIAHLRQGVVNIVPHELNQLQHWKPDASDEIQDED